MDISIYGGTDGIPKHVFLEDVRLYYGIHEDDINRWLDKHPEYRYNDSVTLDGLHAYFKSTKKV